MGNDTYFAYSNGDSPEVSVGHGGDFVPGPDGIRLLFPSPVSGSSAEYAVFGLVSTSTETVELRSSDGSRTPVSVYDLPGDFSAQAKAIVIPPASSGVITGTLVALDGQENKLGRVQIPDVQEAQSPSPQP